MHLLAWQELAERVATRLRESGTPPALVDKVLKPGFFPNGREGLVELAKKMGLLRPDEHVVVQQSIKGK